MEGPSRTDSAKLRGRIRHNKTVNFAGMASPGELAEVEIASATSTTLAGEESLVFRVELQQPRAAPTEPGYVGRP